MNSDNIHGMVYKSVIECLEKNGVIVDFGENEDLDLTSYDIDSVSFISFIVDLEADLNISVPDDFLNYNILQSFNGLINMITQIVNDIK